LNDSPVDCQTRFVTEPQRDRLSAMAFANTKTAAIARGGFLYAFYAKLNI
jgi:hypothetical protein